MTFFLVVYVVALVFTAVRPLKHAMALHFVVHPQTFVFTTIGPIVDAVAFDVVLDEFARVSALVSPRETPLPMLASFDVVSFVACTIGPRL